jgi:hypothetical protein
MITKSFNLRSKTYGWPLEISWGVNGMLNQMTCVFNSAFYFSDTNWKDIYSLDGLLKGRKCTSHCSKLFCLLD